MTNVVALVFKPLSPFTGYHNVIDFAFKALSQSSRLWDTWVTNLVDKLFRQNLVSHSHASNAFSKGMLLTGLSGLGLS